MMTQAQAAPEQGIHLVLVVVIKFHQQDGAAGFVVQFQKRPGLGKGLLALRLIEQHIVNHLDTHRFQVEQRSRGLRGLAHRIEEEQCQPAGRRQRHHPQRGRADGAQGALTPADELGRVRAAGIEAAQVPVQTVPRPALRDLPVEAGLDFFAPLEYPRVRFRK